MKWLKVGVGIFLLVGILIALFSVYKASVDGLMKKVGLVGADFSVAVVQEKLNNINLETKSKLECDLPSRFASSIAFFLSNDQQQGQKAFVLGQQRIKCGTTMLASGDVETGTYEIVKGMGYLKQGYNFVIERGEIDNRVCEGLPQEQLDTLVQQILEATNGKVYEIIWDGWQTVARLRGQAEKICLDQHI